MSTEEKLLGKPSCTSVQPEACNYPDDIKGKYGCRWLQAVYNSSCGRFQGWEGGVKICMIITVVTLSFNILLTIVSLVMGDIRDGLATIQKGSCSKSKNVNTWLHLVINVLGTILLSASNYCIQCLCAPTRLDIDQAHAKEQWLDFGTQSFRNLKSLGWKKQILWISFGISSVPLHLFYNSTILRTQAKQEHLAVAGYKGLWNDTAVNWTLVSKQLDRDHHDLWNTFLVSCIYLIINDQLTKMLLANEWSSYAHSRKALRVSEPKGIQRSTYRLQVPYKYSIPLMVASALVHWFTSQGFYPVRLDTYARHDSSDLSGSISQLAVSYVSLYPAMEILFLILPVSLALGARSLKPGKPFVGSCSAGISAACHPPADTDGYEAVLKPLTWGITGSVAQEGQIGHCSFTSEEVGKPVIWQKYA